MSVLTIIVLAYGLSALLAFGLSLWAGYNTTIESFVEDGDAGPRAFVRGISWPFYLRSFWRIRVAATVHNYAVFLRVTPTSNGYWIVLQSGAWVPFGDAFDHNLKSQGVKHANYNETAAAGESHQYDKNGKVFVSSDGLHHGDFRDRVEDFEGRLTDMLVMSDRSGYWILDGNGVVTAFGAAPFYGDLAKSHQTFNLSARWTPKMRHIRPARLLLERIPELEEAAVVEQVADDSHLSL
jgi:hypothetical protein